MKKSRYSETQIIKILHEIEGGRQVHEDLPDKILRSQLPCHNNLMQKKLSV